MSMDIFHAAIFFLIYRIYIYLKKIHIFGTKQLPRRPSDSKFPRCPPFDAISSQSFVTAG